MSGTWNGWHWMAALDAMSNRRWSLLGSNISYTTETSPHSMLKRKTREKKTRLSAIYNGPGTMLSDAGFMSCQWTETA